MIDAPKSVWQGTFRLFGVDVKCHVLDNGQRIIEADSLEELFTAIDDDIIRDPASADANEFFSWCKGR